MKKDQTVLGHCLLVSVSIVAQSGEEERKCLNIDILGKEKLTITGGFSLPSPPPHIKEMALKMNEHLFGIIVF